MTVRGGNCWLVKSEPESYGIAHLRADGRTPWSGVRNYLARNRLRAMRPGDRVLFYHSNCAVPGVYGVAEVASAPYPDETQFDPGSPYHDPRATHEQPVWDLVDLAFVRAFERPVTIAAMRAEPALAGMEILRKGSRLSVTPVTDEEFRTVLRMA